MRIRVAKVNKALCPHGRRLENCIKCVHTPVVKPPQKRDATILAKHLFAEYHRIFLEDNPAWDGSYLKKEWQQLADSVADFVMP